MAIADLPRESGRFDPPIARNLHAAALFFGVVRALVAWGYGLVHPLAGPVEAPHPRPAEPEQCPRGNAVAETAAEERTGVAKLEESDLRVTASHRERDVMRGGLAVVQQDVDKLLELLRSKGTR